MMLTKYFDDNRIFQLKAIDPHEIPFSEYVTKACSDNICGKYGTCWTCPPGVGNPHELEKKIKSYKLATVFSCKYDLEDSFDFETMMEGNKATDRVLREILERLKNDGIEFMALGCEGCRLCEKCTYPTSPCRFPQKAIPSVEACGISVIDLARNIGINYNNGPNTVTYFCIVLTK